MTSGTHLEELRTMSIEMLIPGLIIALDSLGLTREQSIPSERVFCASIRFLLANRAALLRTRIKAYLHLLGSVGRLLVQTDISMVGLWHMDGTDGLQYIGGIGDRNEVAARCVSYIPTTPRLGMFVFASLQLQLSALALRRALSSVLYASMIGPYLAFIVSLFLRAMSPDWLVTLSSSNE